MRIVFELRSFDNSLKLPIHYNNLLQGLIYRNLSLVLAQWLHEEGIVLEKRKFKFFTFSRLLGKYRIVGNSIEFNGPVRFYVGSIHEQILQSLAEHLLQSPELRLGQNTCTVTGMEVKPPPVLSLPVKVRTLSPITIYSTLATATGKRKTYYYSPFEKEFGEQLLINLRRKAKALGWREMISEEAYIRPLRVDTRDLKIVMYKDTVIKAWTGLYELNLPESFFFLAYDAGLGAKNSQGFGMVEIIKEGER